jgi:hypothetical protein
MVRLPGSEKQPSVARSRDDGRKQLLVYLPPDLIKDLKKAALDEDRNVYDLVEEASREWLARRGETDRQADAETGRPEVLGDENAANGS